MSVRTSESTASTPKPSTRAFPQNQFVNVLFVDSHDRQYKVVDPRGICVCADVTPAVAFAYAIKDASNNGASIILPGDYNIVDLEMPDGVMLSGAGNRLTNIQGALTGHNIKNLAFNDMSFQGRFDFDNVENIAFTHCDISLDACSFSKCSDITFHRCSIKGGLSCTDVSGLSLRDCVFTEVKIERGGLIVERSSGDRLTLTECAAKLLNNSFVALDVFESKDVSIESNIIEFTQEPYGVHLKNVDSVMVARNIFNAGLYLAHTTKVKIANNIFSAPAAIFEDHLCEWNTIESNDIKAGAYLAGSHTHAVGNIGINTESHGMIAFDGDGRTSSFTFKHGLIKEPKSVHITPASLAAARSHSWPKADAHDITIEFLSPPTSGRQNVVLYWTAKTAFI